MCIQSPMEAEGDIRWPISLATPVTVFVVYILLLTAYLNFVFRIASFLPKFPTVIAVSLPPVCWSHFIVFPYVKVKAW